MEHDHLAIELDRARRTFGVGDHHVVAVDRVDLSIGRGEIVALLGPNGAGKTTVLDLVLGFVPPTEGEVRVLGRSPRTAVRDGLVGAVLQTGGLLDDLTVRETATLIASTYQRPRSVGEALERAGISAIGDRRVGKCSGGEQQRLRFALAVLAEPKLLILDEPTVGLDVAGRHSFWEAIAAEATRGLTVVFATHYLDEADDFARRTILMNHGQVVADAPTAQLRAERSGTKVSATVTEAVAEQLATHGLVRSTDAHPTLNGARVTVDTSDGDAVARWLLDHGANGLEIRHGGLDAALLALTADDNSLTTENN